MNQDWDDAAERRSKMRPGRRAAAYTPPTQQQSPTIPPVTTRYPNDMGQRTALPQLASAYHPIPNQQQIPSVRMGKPAPEAPQLPARTQLTQNRVAVAKTSSSTQPQTEYTGLRDIHGNPIARRGAVEKTRRTQKQGTTQPTKVNTEPSKVNAMGYEQVAYPVTQPLAPPMYPMDEVIDLSTNDIPQHLRRPKPLQQSERNSNNYPTKVSSTRTELPTKHGQGTPNETHMAQSTAIPMQQYRETQPDAESNNPPADANAGTCPTCFGAGYLRLDVAVGHPSFGKAIPCLCRKLTIEERRRSELWRISSLDAFQDMTFNTFNMHIAGTREGWEAAQNYAADPEGWIVLSGPCGSGKTHLAAAIANAQFQEGTLVLFTVVPELLDHMRATFGPHSNTTYDAFFEKVLDAGMLVLDDLGSENSTPWAQEKLFQIINHRYMYRMPTVITTNLELMNDLDDRVRSRLTDISLVRHVRISGQDYRPRHAPPRQSRQKG